MPQQPERQEEYKCRECGQTFTSEREQREHQEKMHGGGKAKSAAQGQGRHGGQSKQ